MSRQPGRVPLLLNLPFAVSGAATVLLGPLLPYFNTHAALTDEQAGRLFLVQFLASTSGALLLGFVSRWLRLERVVAACYLTIGVGAAGLAWMGPATAPAWVAVYGFATGPLNPAANALAARYAARGNAVGPLSLLNLCWSLGAVMAPPLVSFGLGRVSFAAVLGVLGLLALAGAAAAMYLPLAPAPHVSARMDGPRPSNRNYQVLWTALFLFLYVGAETSVSGWLPLHAFRRTGLEASLSGLPQAMFWAAIAAVRLFAGIKSAAAQPQAWMLTGLAVAATGTGVLLTTERVSFLLAGALLAGAGFAPLFPAAVANLEQNRSDASASRTGYAFAAGGLGGAVFPWLVGEVSKSSGSLTSALLIAVACVVCLFGVSAALLRPRVTQ